MDLSHFDIVEFFTNHQIPLRKQTRHAVNINCPFCHDSKYHCGVFLDFKNFTCWKCGASGGLFELLRKLFVGTSEQIIQLITSSQKHFREETQDRILGILSREEKKEKNLPTITFPEQAIPVCKRTVEMFSVVEKYLQRRNVSIAQCEAHGVQVCISGPLGSRLIFPIYFENRLVAFQAREMLGCTRVPKYLTYPKDVDISSFLYGYDEFEGETVVIVEGVFDQWVLERCSVACFGSVLSSVQRGLVLKLKPKEIVVGFDPDVWESEKAQKVLDSVSWFSSVGIPVLIARFPKGTDPASLGTEETLKCIENAEDARSIRC